MSTSQTYRPAHLTEEQRRELAAAFARSRLHDDVLPAIRQQAAVQARALEAQGRLPQGTAIVVEERLAGTASLAEVQAIASEVHGGPARRAALELQLVHLEADLHSLERVAADGTIPEPTVAPSTLAVHEARATLEDGRLEDAAARLVDAQQRIASLDAEVTDQLAAVEVRRRTEAAVLDALRTLGFEPQPLEEHDAGSLVVAARGDGHRARIEVSQVDGATSFTASFTDPGDAVGSQHPEAGSVCDPAVDDAAAFHGHLNQRADLELGPVVAARRPTRGVGRAPTGRGARRPMQPRKRAR